MRRWQVTMLGALLLAAAPAPAQPFVVVVNPDAPVSTLSRDALSRIFLKKVMWWEGGVPMRPVDRTYDSPIREQFSDRIIRRSVRAVRSHWQQAIFSGQETPPPVFSTDDEVIAYVKRTPGAIGYVSPQAPLDGVRALRIE